MPEKPKDANKSRKPRAVVCWETGEVFPNLRAAAKAVGISGSGMIGVAAREGGRAGGFHWFYEGDPRPDASTFKDHRKRPVICYETGEEFESAAAASRVISGEGRFLNVDAAAREGGMAGGYHWHYKDQPKPEPGELKGNKPVVCWETGRVFTSAQAAAEWAGTSVAGIYTALRCHTLSGGYHWYLEGELQPQLLEDRMRMPRAVVCWETGEVYASAKQAATAVGLKWATTLKPALEHPHRTAGGYHWYWADQPRPKESDLKQPQQSFSRLH